MASRQRPGLPSVATLPAQMRQVLEPMMDLLGRVVLASSVSNIRAISGRLNESLDPAATNAEIVARVNEIAKATNAAIAKVNEVIARLQED